MQKIYKGSLIGLGGMAGLFVVALLAINLYVQSASTQERIEHALSSGLRVPVRVMSTIVTPWGGLKASGITVPQAEPLPGNFLQAADFHASFDWLALLHRRLLVSEVRMNEPRVVWWQSEGGRWRLPSEEAATAGKPAEAAVPKTPRAPSAQWSVSVHRLVASGASFDFLSEQGNLLLELSGVEFDCLDPKAAGTEGNASAQNATLRERLFLREMHTGWSYQKGKLRLSSFQTEIGGGAFRGDVQVETLVKHSPFNVDASFERVDVNQLMREGGQPPDEVNGMLKGSVDLSGNAGKASSMNGTAHLELAGGHMQNLELFQLLGQGLQIPDLVQLDLKRAVADIRVVAGVTQVDRLVLQSQNLELDAHGTVQPTGKLDLQARLTVDAAISQRLPGFILKYFENGAEAETRFIDFEVNNTLSHPKTNLLENILGHQIKSQMTDLIQSLFGKKKPLPTATPSPTEGAQ